MIPAPAPDQRHVFGTAASDWSVRRSVDGTLRVADRVGTAWDARVGGTQLDDLQDLDGSQISEFRATLGQYAFYGPVGVTMLWVDFGGGERELVLDPEAIESAARMADDAASAAALARTGAEQAALEAQAIVTGASPIGFDADGVPYVNENAGESGSQIALDTDGVPYLIGA